MWFVRRSWLGFDVILLLLFSHPGPVSSSYKEPRQTTSCQAAEANKGQATRACSSEMKYSVTCNLQRGLQLWLQWRASDNHSSLVLEFANSLSFTEAFQGKSQVRGHATCFCNNSDRGCRPVRLGWFYALRKKHGWITIADIASANCLFDFVGRRNHRAFLNSTSHRPSGKSTRGSLLWDGTSRNYLRGLLQMQCLTQSNLRISEIDSIKIRLLQFIDAIVIENEHSLDIHSLLDFEEIF